MTKRASIVRNMALKTTPCSQKIDVEKSVRIQPGTCFRKGVVSSENVPIASLDSPEVVSIRTS